MVAEYDFIEGSVGIALEIHSFIPTFHCSIYNQGNRAGYTQLVGHLPEAIRKRVVATVPTTCICRVM